MDLKLWFCNLSSYNRQILIDKFYKSQNAIVSKINQFRVSSWDKTSCAWFSSFWWHFNIGLHGRARLLIVMQYCWRNFMCMVALRKPEKSCWRKIINLFLKNARRRHKCKNLQKKELPLSSLRATLSLYHVFLECRTLRFESCITGKLYIFSHSTLSFTYRLLTLICYFHITNRFSHPI